MYLKKEASKKLSLTEQLNQWIAEKKLLTVHMKQDTNYKVLTGRLIQQMGNYLFFYHEDQKKIYNVAFFEVIDVVEAN